MRRRSLGTSSLGRSSSPAASSSSKECYARWSRTQRSFTHLGATLPKAMPRVLLRCRLGPTHAWQVSTSSGKL
ncbi:hypothetical protein MUK42_26640 [Musa troglodytarum]|uniref:Uncharacterized protein n=1 Tax=Musa troglodytarum TaxID=320322 RepID=A0A9E7EXL4_9LILI|nr:hypothetical protein MUK42_26640 [Musa troglodytarum]